MRGLEPAVAHGMGQSHEPVLVQIELAEVDARAELRADLVEEIVVELQLLQCRPEPNARRQHLEHVVVQVQHLYKVNKSLYFLL